MPAPNATDQSALLSRVDKFRELHAQLHREFMEDGHLDPAEAALLAEISGMIDQAERLLERGGAAAFEDAGEPSLDQGGPAVAPVQASLGGSVGQMGQNAPGDVTTVQTLLNQNGASPALEVDGQSGPKTVRAIADFQQARFGFSDGRVDVGGQTWSALSGAPSGTTAGSASGARTPAAAVEGTSAQPHATASTPAGQLPPEEDRVQAETPGTGDMQLFPETFVTLGPFTFKKQFDANGKLIGCEAEETIGGIALAIPLGLYTLSAGFQLLQVETAILNQEGPVVPVAVKVALKGFGTVEFGVEVLKAIYELSLEGYTEARQLLINTETPAASTSNVQNPLQFFLKGTGECKVSAGSGVESGATVMKGEYDKLLIVTVRDGPDITIERGPGVDKFNDDCMAAIELAKKNPEIIGTGPTVGWTPGDPPDELQPAREKLEADAMQHIADDAQRIMVEAREQQLRNSRAALEDPNVTGGANSMNNRDPAQAARLYGALWQQRTDAIKAAAAYVPYSDGGSASPETKAGEAEALANRCDQVRAAFRSADGQWGYGQTTVWAEEDNGGGGGGAPGGTQPEMPEEEDESIVDEVLDFFGFGDDDED